MNIVAINGSPTGPKGCTGRLLAALTDGAREAGATVTLFELGQLIVKPCTGCPPVSRPVAALSMMTMRRYRLP